MSEIELREKLEALGFFTAIEGHPVVAIEVDRAINVFAPVIAARDAEIAVMREALERIANTPPVLMPQQLVDTFTSVRLIARNARNPVL